MVGITFMVFITFMGDTLACSNSTPRYSRFKNNVQLNGIKLHKPTCTLYEPILLEVVVVF